MRGGDAPRRYCEAVFAPDLGGHPLLSNRSTWLRFRMVTNRRWHHGNVVLLGDALRTVHFSIGSGTRTALEDAIALARALAEHGATQHPAARGGAPRAAQARGGGGGRAPRT